MWFEQLTGFKEESPKNVRNNIKIIGSEFVSLVNSQKFSFGKLEVTTLAELKKQKEKNKDYNARIEVKETVADVQELHCHVEN